VTRSCVRWRGCSPQRRRYDGLIFQSVCKENAKRGTEWEVQGRLGNRGTRGTVEFYSLSCFVMKVVNLIRFTATRYVL